MRIVPGYVLALLLGAALISSPGTSAAFGHQRSGGPAPPTQQVVLEVCHPKTGCKIAVPVCVPCCCQGTPCARFEPTCIGPGRTVFTWPCGHQVVVRYGICGGYRVVQRD